MAEARRQFESLYPKAELIDVRVTENEVLAESFAFRYRKSAGEAEKEIEIQFMEDERTGKWRPSPSAPKDLP